MSRTRELAAGGRAMEVEPERLVGFLDRFAAGHGRAVATTITPQRVDVTAVDSWTASVVERHSACMCFVIHREDGVWMTSLVRARDVRQRGEDRQPIRHRNTHYLE